ncbi:ATP-binding protein [Motilimonas eburnea]|uniref:ATP-binding protein n=1 Tax=Motilimonas eburnea TaxID=1737488 RepID=UPI001E38144B|nr:ATP-binding protein [Motilimonas eburnea]MCE2571294.1 GHKL domain-containing protein [Motilimonas eburnea]
MQIKLSLKFKLLSTSLLVLLIGLYTFSYYQILNHREQLLQQQQNLLQNIMTGLFSEGLMQEETINMPKRVSYGTLNIPNANLVAIVCDQGSQQIIWSSISGAHIPRDGQACPLLSSLVGDEFSQMLTFNINGVESRYGELEINQEPMIIQLAQLQQHRAEMNKNYVIAVAKDADDLEQAMTAFTRKVYRRSIFLFCFFTALFYLTIKWSLSSLTRLTRELNSIKAGEREALSRHYEPELQSLTSALNQLLHSEREQKTRYQHSMNDLAHSLKTRLALLKAVSEEQNTTSKAFNHTLNDQISQMDQIVHYQLRRAVSGRQNIIGKPIAIAPEVTKLMNTLDKVYRHKRIQFELSDPDNAIFFGQQDDLMELMGNLLDNACKFTLSQIHISAKFEKNKGLSLIIEDDGLGIDTAIRNQILKRGVRADSSGGQGIGLAVTSEIVHSYGGDIEIFDSELGGAGFKLFFPVA